MQTSDILAAIDEEISRLQEVRRLLAGSGHAKRGSQTMGSSASFPFGINKAGAPRRRHNISAAGRARIAAAQKARWAKMKRANAEKNTRK